MIETKREILIKFYEIDKSKHESEKNTEEIYNKNRYTQVG